MDLRLTKGDFRAKYKLFNCAECIKIYCYSFNHVNYEKKTDQKGEYDTCLSLRCNLFPRLYQIARIAVFIE